MFGPRFGFELAESVLVGCFVGYLLDRGVVVVLGDVEGNGGDGFLVELPAIASFQVSNAGFLQVKLGEALVVSGVERGGLDCFVLSVGSVVLADRGSGG